MSVGRHGNEPVVHEEQNGAHRDPWVEPAYSRTRVDQAGHLLVGQDAGSLTDLDLATTILANFRSAHGFPLNTVQVTLRSRAKEVDQGTLVVQRLKRRPSILSKLRRSQTMRLSQMQDIGGCRAVLDTVDQVYALESLYRTRRSTYRVLTPFTDYIANPPSSGYRSLHIIAKFKSVQRPAFNNLLIEIQLRSRLQHAWATAVETVDLFRGSDLKTNQGDPRWRRLFALVATAFALKERTPPVPGTPETMDDLLPALRASVQELQLVENLRAWSAMLHHIQRQEGFRARKYFLIDARPASHSVEVISFAEREFEAANSLYSALEAEGAEPVLVAASSFAALLQGYSGYFADTSRFIQEVEGILDRS